MLFEGLAMIFIVFIVIQVVVFDKKKYGDLWVGAQTAGLIFMMAVAPFSSIFAIRNELPMKVAWIFHFFTLADIIFAFFYIRSKIRDYNEHKQQKQALIKIQEERRKEQEAKQAEENQQSHEHQE